MFDWYASLTNQQSAFACLFGAVSVVSLCATLVSVMHGPSPVTAFHPLSECMDVNISKTDFCTEVARNYRN